MFSFSLALALVSLGGAGLLSWVLQGWSPPKIEPVEPTSETEATEEPMQRAADRFVYRDTSSHRPAASVRSRPVMTARRSSSGTGEAAYQRLARRTEEQMDAMNIRMEENTDRTVMALEDIAAELREIKTDVRRLEQNDGQLTNRIGDLELQVNMTRDEVQRSQGVPTVGRVQSARTAISDAVKSPWGRVVTFCVGFAAIISALSLVPKAVDVVSDSWAYIDDMNEPDTARAATK